MFANGYGLSLSEVQQVCFQRKLQLAISLMAGFVLQQQSQLKAMDFPKIRTRTQRVESIKVQTQQSSASPNGELSFSFNDGTGTSKLSKNASFEKRFPQSIRGPSEEAMAANPKQFIEFMRRMSKNQSGRVQTETGRTLNSTIKSVKANSTRRSQTEGDQSSTKLNKMDEDPSSRLSSVEAIKQTTPKGDKSKREDLEKSPSELGSSILSVAAFESDIKYLQKLVLLKDEEIEILKQEKDLMTKRYIKEAEAMQDEVEELKQRVNRFEFGSGDINISAQIDKVKKQLHQSKTSKLSSIEGNNKSASIKEVIFTEESDSLKAPKIDPSALRLNISSTPRLPQPEEFRVAGITGEQDRQTLLAKLKQYDKANRALTKNLAITNDRLAFINAEKRKYETIIFELQNQNQLYRKQLREQKDLSRKFEEKKLQLNRTLGNLRKYG